MERTLQRAESSSARRGAGGPVRTAAWTNPRIARVALGIRDLLFHQEVMDFLSREPRVDVVAAHSEAQPLLRQAAASSPDILVACPRMIRELRHPSASERPPATLVVAGEMTVPVLRDAIDAAAAGVYAWPDERAELVDAILRGLRSGREDPIDRALVVAVTGARGGVGTTFVSTHLAAAFCDLGRRAVLADLDAGFAGVTVALGLQPTEPLRTVADLLPVVGELSPSHVEDALFEHPRGFKVLLAPSDSRAGRDIPPGLYRGCIALLAGDTDVVVLHLPRMLDDVARVAIDLADLTLLVFGPDLFSLYGGRRLTAALGLSGGERIRPVLNHPRSPEVSTSDVERVLGTPPFARIRHDAAVPRAQANGELLRTKARRAATDIRRLAGLLWDARPAVTVDEEA
jgi:pilus assembly protein CpaE